MFREVGKDMGEGFQRLRVLFGSPCIYGWVYIAPLLTGNTLIGLLPLDVCPLQEAFHTSIQAKPQPLNPEHPEPGVAYGYG